MNKAILECRQVVKTFYDGSRELNILRGIDLTIEEGKIHVISGHSGAGKSTLLHIIGTLDRPTSGSILFHGEDLAKIPGGAINRIRNEEIGFVFQFYHLLPEFTALENVMMPGICKGRGRGECRSRAEELLTTVGLAERMTHKPGKLSGGEQQRVAIARALFNKPSVVLADEPIGNLDEDTGAEIVDLIWDLNATENVTLVIVTHDLDLAKRADTWFHLQDGVTTAQ